MNRRYKLQWQKCQCGHASCQYEFPTNLGSYYQGTGFQPDEKELLDRAFAALEEKEAMNNEQPTPGVYENTLAPTIPSVVAAERLHCWHLIKATAVQEYDPLSKTDGLLFKNHKTGDFAFICAADVVEIEAALAVRAAPTEQPSAAVIQYADGTRFVQRKGAVCPPTAQGYTVHYVSDYVASLVETASPEALREALAAERERDGWQDIATAPMDGTPILYWSSSCAIPETVCFLNGPRIATPGWYPYAGGNWFVAGGREPAEARWQPLPAPPRALPEESR